MSLIQLNEPQTEAPRWVFLSVGFRPFFTFGAMAGAVLMLVWVTLYRGLWAAPLGHLYGWHAHEMIFGYGLAIIAGFLLTAVRNWTGLDTARGWLLGSLLLLWLLPRPLFLLLPLSPWLSALDLAFVPLLAIVLARPIVAGRNWRNLMFVPILLGFFICNLIYHLGLHGRLQLDILLPLKLALELIMMLITIIGARVMPMFTRNGTGGAVQPAASPQRPLILLCLGMAQLLAGLLGEGFAMLQAGLSGLFALAILLTWFSWQGLALWQKPMLWILHIAYLSLGLSFILKALTILQLSPVTLWVHSAAVATMGAMTLGFIGRVSLGHSGRPLIHSKLMVASYVLMLLAAVLRLIAGIYPLTPLWDSAALCWALALGLFAYEFIPHLLAPRADGKPG
ncbi:MAG: NnrS family protein [Cellvibrionaceae bacterium]|nr:NnrS family protein [Cellvibrionaceae bacterium]